MGGWETPICIPSLSPPLGEGQAETQRRMKPHRKDLRLIKERPRWHRDPTIHLYYLCPPRHQAMPMRAFSPSLYLHLHHTGPFPSHQHPFPGTNKLLPTELRSIIPSSCCDQEAPNGAVTIVRILQKRSIQKNQSLPGIHWSPGGTTTSQHLVGLRSSQIPVT